MDTKLRRAGLTVATGLVLQLLSLGPLHPLAFLAFVCLGLPVTTVGVVFFLLAIVKPSESGE